MPPPFRPGDPTATPPGEDITDPNYLRAKSEYTAKHYRQVLHLTAKVLEANPGVAPPHWYRGMAYYYTGSYQAGLAEMEQALTINPNYALAYADRGLIYSALGDDEHALADYEKALSLDPSLAKTWHNIAALQHNRGQAALAVAAGRRAVAIDPGRAWTWANLSGALLSAKQYDQCKEAATQAIAIDPQQWLAYFNRGSCAVAAKQPQAAVADLTTYLDAVNDPQGWYNRGLAYRHQNNLQQALKDYTRALELDPTFSWAYFNRRGVYSDLGMADRASDDMNAVNAPRTVEQYLRSGDSYFAIQHFDLAIRAYLLAFFKDSADVRIAVKLARAYLEHNEHNRAISIATQALAVEPKGSQDLSALQVRGRAYYWLGEYMLAIDDLNTVIATSPSALDYYYRGIAYQDSGQREQAIQDLKAFLQRAGTGDEVHSEIEDAQASLAELQN